MISLSKKHASKGLVILAVNAWNEPQGKVQEFVKAQGINYTVALQGGDVAAAWGVNGIPTSFCIDAQGQIVSEGVGAESESELERRLKAILPGT